MKIIFAQGNPGKQYEKTRHNVGFLACDALSVALDTSWHESSKFNALIAETTKNGEKVLLVKPLSFYNDTGTVARAIADFYKVTPASDILVLHDELMLPFGTLRMRNKGRDAGNNGVKSLNAHLGQNYWRLRIGIWTPLRDERPDTDYVLGAFSAAERTALKTDLIPLIEQWCDDFLAGKRETKSATVAT